MTTACSITQFFEFLAQDNVRLVEKYEVCSIKFSLLRKSMRRMILLLREEGDEESRQLSDRIRGLLSRWLTTPVEFDHSLLESLKIIDAGAGFETRWGLQIATAYEAACDAARELAGCPNPLRQKLEEIVENFVREGKRIRIYCHRSAITDFQFLTGATAPQTEIFLHTPRDYREANIFDVLVKIGPLRPRGWGAVPDAVLTAPRFNRMAQIVWNGCQDEPDFGYDPINASAVTEANTASTAKKCINRMSWQTTTTKTGDATSSINLEPDEDDFRILSEIGRSEERRRCVHLQLDEKQGILYSPRAEVLSFDPSAEAENMISFRLPNDGLSEGMYLIETEIYESISLGAHAEEGKYSRIWKQHLHDKLLFDDNFVSKLRNDGINLIHLQQSLLHWSKPATSVVHAPQRRKHFEILIRNLDIDYSKYTSGFSHKTSWWSAAWNEVTKTRGEAIQTGMTEHRIADERLLELLNSRITEIQGEAEFKNTFPLSISREHELVGMAIFHKIVAIEEGFLAPDCNLRTVSDLEEIEQWRE